MPEGFVCQVEGETAGYGSGSDHNAGREPRDRAGGSGKFNYAGRRSAGAANTGTNARDSRFFDGFFLRFGHYTQSLAPCTAGRRSC